MSNTSSRPLITFDPAGALHPLHGLQAGDLTALTPLLERARQAVLVEDARLYRDKSAPTDKQLLDHGFFEMPERLLAEYHKDRGASELGRILATAQRLTDPEWGRMITMGTQPARPAWVSAFQAPARPAAGSKP